VRRLAFVGSFRAGPKIESLAVRAEENYTGGTGGGAAGPISGVSPQVPLLPGKAVYNLADPSGPASLLSDVASSGAPSASHNVFVYVGYSTEATSVSVDSLYIFNQSDERVFLTDVQFIGIDPHGQVIARYQYSCDNCIGTDYGPYVTIVDPRRSVQIGLGGTSVNPTNTFDHAMVNVRTRFRDPAISIYHTYNNVLTPQ
jgi:hypothetical protein